MSSSAINAQLFQAKIGSIQNQADSTSVYSAGVWSFKNSTALTSVTISDAGNVGINAVSPTSRLTIGTGTFTAAAAQTTGMYTNGTNGLVVLTDAMSVNSRTGTNFLNIDASGNLMVGKTASSDTIVGLHFLGAGPATSTLSQSTNATTSWATYSTGAAAYRFYVGMGGTVFATSTTITGISDERLKENIRDLDDGLDVVLALKPRKFDWKAGKGADIKNARGFIAQEFEQVLPDMIEEWKDPAPEGEEPYKAVNANLIPTLVKAIQEQQAQIESLKAEVAALKAP